MSGATVRVMIALAAAAPLQAQSQADSLLRQALLAAGGSNPLTAAGGLEWEARAVVHIPGRDIPLRGVWKIQPPDSAVVATYDTTRGPGTTRRLIVAGSRGWLERDSQLTPMPPELLAEERHQFYLYSLLRLVPLQQPGVTLRPVPSDSDGHPGFRAEQPGRLPVTLYFDSTSHVTRIMTSFATPGQVGGDSQDIRLSGTIEAGGIRWFRRMEIARAGQPYFEMELLSLRVFHRLSDPWLAGPPPH